MQIVEPNPRAQHPDYANTPENRIPRTYRWVGVVDIGSETLQINSAQDFLESPKAQEYAMAAYLNEQKKSINTLELNHYIGKTIQGVEGKIKITMEGLVAASHRRGVGKLKEYLQALGQGGDTSFDYNSESAYRDVDQRQIDAFLQVETRLREFQDFEEDEEREGD
ncbi:MAG: hypothetical protein QNJ84_15385 [Alphaproteobacteria bacterium]|nr:hypothetical protein [Alphaproteobacteria bacterium]